MQGTIKPNRIILWLSKDEFINQQIPITLQKQKKRGLEIEFCDELFSYKK
jgi:predicted transcriptional regulator